MVEAAACSTLSAFAPIKNKLSRAHPQPHLVAAK